MTNPKTTDTSSTATGNTPPPPPPVELPEAIIQHIQSFLNGKKAAQTTLLSKSWYTAWLTRPNLDFDVNYFVDSDFRNFNYDIGIRFWNFVNKTMERYDKLNLQIHSLRLCIHSYPKTCLDLHSCSNATKLIIKALNMGATCLDLNVSFKDLIDYKSVEYGCYQILTPFTLPHQVFGSENLNTLSVSRCKIDGKVSCSRLKSLTLDNAIVEGDRIWDIISSCPLIENLSITPWSKFGKKIVESGPFNKLKSLLLSRVEVHSLLFKDFSSKFPCLKDLSIHGCCCDEEIQISSPSLECINFKENTILGVKFDVPRIRKFTFSGSTSSSLTFKTTSRNWESSINICHFSPMTASWFKQLNEFLKRLSQSKVSLSLEILPEASLDHDTSLQGLTKPEVENLMIGGWYSVRPNTFRTLFQLCRPIYITQYWLPGPECCITNEKRMMRQDSLNTCIAYQRVSGGECDLEEVSVEFYDESVSAWCPRLFDAWTSPEADEQRLRLHLTWRH
ncbi:hypothetical protein ACS0TY_009323 [Phlomoides rotata]